jgi:hypothetical protein
MGRKSFLFLVVGRQPLADTTLNQSFGGKGFPPYQHKQIDPQFVE